MTHIPLIIVSNRPHDVNPSFPPSAAIPTACQRLCSTGLARSGSRGARDDEAWAAISGGSFGRPKREAVGGTGTLVRRNTPRAAVGVGGLAVATR